MHPSTDPGELLSDISGARSFNELFQVARKELIKFRLGATLVLGPWTRHGDFEANREHLEEHIHRLQQQGEPVFSIIPYQGKIDELRSKRYDEAQTLDRYLPEFDEFLRLIIASTFVTKVYFTPGWNEDKQMEWAHDVCEFLQAKFNITICYLKDSAYA